MHRAVPAAVTVVPVPRGKVAAVDVEGSADKQRPRGRSPVCSRMGFVLLLCAVSAVSYAAGARQQEPPVAATPQPPPPPPPPPRTPATPQPTVDDQWLHQLGALSAGDDLWVESAASVAAAKARCIADDRCAGFSYFSPNSTEPADLPRVYYKTRLSGPNADANWRAVVKQSPEDIAIDRELRGVHSGRFGVDHLFGLPVPSSPAASRLQQGAFDADYDTSRVGEMDSEFAFGGAYKEPDANAAFSYPPRNDNLYLTLSVRPRVLYFPNLLTDDEVDRIRRDAEGQLRRSTVADPVARGGKVGYRDVQSAIRNSRQAWLRMDRGYLRRVSMRLMAIINVSVSSRLWHEQLQVLHYAPGQHYHVHSDYFPDSVYGRQDSNRVATFFLHLGDTSEGGQTALPLAGGSVVHGVPHHTDACKRGLRVWPRRGAGFVFYNMRPDWALDPYAMHAGCDVVKGEKWVAPLWVQIDTRGNAGVKESW
eukprot:TRINITY_DN8434_c0_g1_i1.p1 TRINITY_DN8434_c0_g1~~TRINITY_DN8434_c0_g1_i1.p1  ORF type:complete len:479 (+),score=164.09 TRINITY_DN8434_c0_g1_i1:64-1500(+)